MEKTTEKELLFTREQFAVSENFKDYRDIVYALMHEGEQCSEKALNKRITVYLSKKIG